MPSLRSFFDSLFNVECELPKVELRNGREGVDLRENSLARSHVEIADNIRAYKLDDYYHQNKVINPDKVKGLGCRHDFIIVSNTDAGVEVFFVEMKSSKDGFDHVRHQLQGGLSMFAMMQRFCLDRLGAARFFDDVRYYAVALLHTESLAALTDMTKVAEKERVRSEERSRYANKKGLCCVVDCQLTLDELREHSQSVALTWDKVNSFPDFPI